jgi:hypothetical protein
MNIALFGYIMAWLGVIYFFLVVGFTYYEYTRLTKLQKQNLNAIDATKQFIILVVSTVYIITYHIS